MRERKGILEGLGRLKGSGKCYNNIILKNQRKNLIKENKFLWFSSLQTDFFLLSSLQSWKDLVYKSSLIAFSMQYTVFDKIEFIYYKIYKIIIFLYFNMKLTI